ncbi:probable ATP-dependent DNA helicase HFM1 [Sitodiplosis mosellana]|uniref:probable ATP-dependent DNA helicase HFM1 n=1 Tax=Sitodiplosis mosellana TaxID=263140 RepID=UPI0024450FE7|nr:probable ATP-dependent DNA helicase HFM1 [Sitodiplosis mosellana]
MSSLRDLTDIPAKYRSIFSPIRQFNRVQSEIFDDVFRTKKHIVVSAPTGSGKTAIFELAIVNLLMSLEQTNCNTESVKIVYVAPTKALCNEMFQKWQEKFSAAVDLKVALVTGDSDPTDMSDLIDLSPYQIAVTTPEKWDSMTRKWKDHTEIANAVRLVLIDEVHLVGDTSRGPTLEAIVSRIKTFPQNRRNNGQIRFISVSASLPNIEDVAKWICAGQPDDSVRTFKIEENQRPIKLKRYVRGFTPQTNSFYFNNYLTSELIKIVDGILAQLSTEKQILIFCPTRNDVESSLDQLRNGGQLLGKVQLNGMQRSILKDVCSRIKDDKLRSAVKVGFAFHHAGLSYDDREQIENAYRNGAIKILLSTNTLAMGVNLPAHTVIIKSTEHFFKGTTQEISDSMILQMMGRAGRQQYNTTGCVYIMTKADRKEFYEKLAVGTVQIESHLNNKLAEFLNAEIALNTITDNDASVMQWLRTTFLFTRTTNRSAMTKNSNEEAALKDLCKRAIEDLQRSKAVELKPDGSVSTLPFGVIMAKYFLSIPTIVAFQGLRGSESIFGILDKIVCCNEFTDIYVRRNEKKILNDVNYRLRFPIPSISAASNQMAIQTVPQKVSCLLQAFLSGETIENSGLLVDQRRIVQITERMTSSLIDFFQTSQFTNECFDAILASTILIKSLRTKTWSDRDVFGELNISKADADKLIKSGVNNVDTLMQTKPREIEDILNKGIQFGKHLIDEAVKKFPCYAVNVDVMAGHAIIVRVAQTNFGYTRQSTTVDTGLTLLIGDSCNRLIYYDDIQPALNDSGCFEKLLSIESKATVVRVHVIHHNLVGADKMVEYCIGEKTTPEKNVTPVKKINKNVLPKNNKRNSKSKKFFAPKTPSDKSSKSTGKQSTMSQYFVPKMNKPDQNTITPQIRSAFEPINRISASKKLIFSPDLFSTPIEATQKPEQLYNFDYLPSSSNSTPPNQLGDVYINQSDEVKQTPCLAETPIQSKIQEQRNKQDGSMNGFVRANAIFKNDIVNDSTVEKPADTRKQSSIHHLCLDNIESLFADFDQVEDVDQVEDEVLQILGRLDSPDPSNSQTKTRGMADAPMHKKDCDESIQKILNVNVKIDSSEVIKNDFDDSDEWLNQVEMPQSCQPSECIDLPSEFWNDFNSDDSTTNHVEKDTYNDEPPAKIMAIKNVGEKNSTVVRVSPPKQRTVLSSPNKQQPSTSALSASQVSASSNEAVCGSPKRNESSAELKSPEPSISRMNVSEFAFRPPPKMLPSTSRQTNMKRSANYTEPKPFVPKKSKLIDVLMKNGEKKQNEYGRTINSLTNGNVKQQKVGKTSLKQVFTRITRNEPKPDVDADMMLEQCKERLKTDANYNEHDFARDFCKYKILKLAPPNPQLNDEEDTMFPDLDELTHVSYDDNTFNFATPSSCLSFNA